MPSPSAAVPGKRCFVTTLLRGLLIHVNPLPRSSLPLGSTCQAWFVCHAGEWQEMLLSDFMEEKIS